MKRIWTMLARELKAIHSDERGADMVEYVLIVAVIALPLLGVIIWFWRDISAKAGELWNDIKGNTNAPGQSGTDPGSLGH